MLGGMIGPTVEEAAARDHHPANGGGIGNCGSGNTAKQHRSGNVGQAKPAAHPADHGIGKSHNARGNAAAIHQVTGQNKARDTQQNEHIHPGKQFLRDHDKRDAFEQKIAQR